jgi:thiol-disulfide isomerase/thioredoxin
MPPAPTVELKFINYEQLGDAVRAQRGKVVVVDVWGVNCVPCMREFPHLVEMHRQYASEGLACFSVCIPQSDKEPLKDKPKALEFLTRQNATFANFLLENGWRVCNDRWNIENVPATFVFDREGRRVKKFNGTGPNDQYDMGDVEKLVVELLRSKK